MAGVRAEETPTTSGPSGKALAADEESFQREQACLQAVRWHGLAIARRYSGSGIWAITIRFDPSAVVETYTSAPNRHDSDGRLRQLPTVRLNPVKARLAANGIDERKSIDPASPSVTFRIRLSPGPIDLRTWLTDEDGTARSAYFATIEAVD